MLARALRTHPDGGVWGFRALIPGLHTTAYERRLPVKSTGRGLAGAFTQLLERHEELEQLIRQLIRSREVFLIQEGERFYLRSLHRAHERFKESCRGLGLTGKDYPLNHDEAGRRSLRTALRQRMLDGFAQANRSAGGEGVKPAAALAFTPSRPVTDPLDTVEFEAHKLDLRLKILDQDPEGEEHVLEIEPTLDRTERKILLSAVPTSAVNRDFPKGVIRTSRSSSPNLRVPAIMTGYAACRDRTHGELSADDIIPAYQFGTTAAQSFRNAWGVDARRARCRLRRYRHQPALYAEDGARMGRQRGAGRRVWVAIADRLDPHHHDVHQVCWARDEGRQRWRGRHPGLDGSARIDRPGTTRPDRHGHSGCGALVWRRCHHAGDFGAERARRSQAAAAGGSAVYPAARGGRADRTVVLAAQGNDGNRAPFRTGHVSVVCDHRSPGCDQRPGASDDPAGARSALRCALPFHPRLYRIHSTGRSVPERDRSRGALRRHGTLRG